MNLSKTMAAISQSYNGKYKISLHFLLLWYVDKSNRPAFYGKVVFCLLSVTQYPYIGMCERRVTCSCCIAGAYSPSGWLAIAQPHVV